MELDDHLREMLKELGQAINESISGSERVHDSIQRIRDAGCNLYIVLDARVGVNRREARGTRQRLPEVSDEESVQTPVATFRINVKDVRLLRALGIDPTRKVRRRRRAAGRTRRASRPAKAQTAD
ncbi:MAG TPA: hypothetical protein VIA29_10400 [Thermoanaerobaculia bacterium]|jgi:hypothetical protein